MVEVYSGAMRMVTDALSASTCQGCMLPPDGARIAAAATMWGNSLGSWSFVDSGGTGATSVAISGS
jgi:hypothetical protein